MSICKLLVVFVMMVAGGCGTSQRFARTGETEAKSDPKPRTESAKPGTNVPSTGKVLLTLEGIASYYADDFHGKQTSNGEIYDMHSLTAAHKTLPFDTMIRVTNLANNKSVVVRVNDRGPYVDGRIIDLSLGAAKAIDLIATGTTRVRLEVLKWGEGTLRH